MRQMPPLAPCFHEVQPRVCQFPLAPLVRSHPGIEWFYHCPLCICQVARVRLPHFIASFHVFILLLASPVVNTGSKTNPPVCKSRGIRFMFQAIIIQRIYLRKIVTHYCTRAIMEGSVKDFAQIGLQALG